MLRFLKSPSLPSEDDIGALTFVGGAGFSGTVTKRYKWYKIGNLVTLSWRMEGTVAGVFSRVLFVLPSRLPTPSSFENYTVNEAAYIGAGGVNSNFATNPGKSALAHDGTDWFIITYAGASPSSDIAFGTLQYLVDGAV